MNWKKIGITSDHAGFEMKEFLKDYLIKEGYNVTDYGPDNNKSSDYPDYAHPLANSIARNDNEIGISLCGSGNGISMTLNKHKEIRAALCWNKEIAKLARSHNNANICSLPARFISNNDAAEIVDLFLKTEFEGGRHLNRINKIPIQ